MTRNEMERVFAFLAEQHARLSIELDTLKEAQERTSREIDSLKEARKQATANFDKYPKEREGFTKTREMFDKLILSNEVTKDLANQVARLLEEQENE